MTKRIETDESIPADDPGWEAPAVLFLEDGSRVELPEITVRDARAFVELALETGALIGGEVDPRRIQGIGPLLEEEG
jgi:hypothetical protein